MAIMCVPSARGAATVQAPEQAMNPPAPTRYWRVEASSAVTSCDYIVRIGTIGLRHRRLVALLKAFHRK